MPRCCVVKDQVKVVVRDDTIDDAELDRAVKAGITAALKALGRPVPTDFRITEVGDSQVG